MSIPTQAALKFFCSNPPCLSIVPLALHPLLQPLPHPLQIIHPSPLHPHLPIQEVSPLHLLHHGITHRCGTVDGHQRIPLLHTRACLLECPSQGPLFARGPGLVCQCGDADFHGSSNSHFTDAFAVKVAFTAETKGGDNVGIWGWHLVSVTSGD